MCNQAFLTNVKRRVSQSVRRISISLVQAYKGLKWLTNLRWHPQFNHTDLHVDQRYIVSFSSWNMRIPRLSILRKLEKTNNILTTLQKSCERSESGFRAPSQTWKECELGRERKVESNSSRCLERRKTAVCAGILNIFRRVKAIWYKWKCGDVYCYCLVKR